MFRNFKRIIFTIFSLMLLLACGSKTTDTNKDEVVKLKWYMSISPVAPDTDKVIGELNKYTREKIGVEIEYIPIAVADYKEKMPTLINSGQDFDIAFTAAWTTNYLQFAQKDAWYDITELLPKYAKETYEFVPKTIWNAVKVDGKIYGVPTYKEMGAQRGILYNKSLADKYGIDVSSIKTIQDYEKVLEQVMAKSKAEGQKMIGIAGLKYNNIFGYEALLNNSELPASYAVDQFNFFNDVKGKVFNQYETKDYENYLNLAHNWFKKGYTSPDPVEYSRDYAARDNDFSTGKLFSYVIQYAPGYKESLSKSLGFEVGFIPLSTPLFQTNNAMGGILAISSASKHPEKALEFLNLLNTDIYVGTLIRHGIEGIHHSAVGTDRTDQTLGGTLSPDKNGYMYTFGWQFGTVFNQKWDISYPENVVELFTEYNKQAIPTPHIGLTIDSSNIQNQIAAVTNVVKKYAEALESGQQDPKALSEFRKELKENGADDIVVEVQKQVDNFKK